MEKRVLSYYDSDTAVSRRNRNYGTMNSDCDTTVGPNDKKPPKIRFWIVKLSVRVQATFWKILSRKGMQSPGMEVLYSHEQKQI